MPSNPTTTRKTSYFDDDRSNSTSRGTLRGSARYSGALGDEEEGGRDVMGRGHVVRPHHHHHIIAQGDDKEDTYNAGGARHDSSSGHHTHHHTRSGSKLDLAGVSKNRMRKMRRERKESLKAKLADSQQALSRPHNPAWPAMNELKQIEEIKAKIYEAQATAREEFRKKHKTEIDRIMKAKQAKEPIPNTGLRKERIEEMHRMTISLPGMSKLAEEVQQQVARHGAYSHAAKGMENPLPTSTNGHHEYHATSALRWLFRAKFQLVEAVLMWMHNKPDEDRTSSQRAFIKQSEEIDELKDEMSELFDHIYTDRKTTQRYHLDDSNDFPATRRGGD